MRVCVRESIALLRIQPLHFSILLIFTLRSDCEIACCHRYSCTLLRALQSVRQVIEWKQANKK